MVRRVARASVLVEGEQVGAIGRGLLVLGVAYCRSWRLWGVRRVGNPDLNFTDLIINAINDLAGKISQEVATCELCWPGCDPTVYEQKMIDGHACDCAPYCWEQSIPCCPLDVLTNGCNCVATCLPNSENFRNCKDAKNERIAAEDYVHDLRDRLGEAGTGLNLTQREKILWQDGYCHRSANSYQARAAKEIEDADDKTR